MAEENTNAVNPADKPKKAGKLISLNDANKALNTEVAAKFKVAQWDKQSSMKIMHTKYGVINLKKISLKKVETLMKMKCPIFEKK